MFSFNAPVHCQKCNHVYGDLDTYTSHYCGTSLVEYGFDILPVAGMPLARCRECCALIHPVDQTNHRQFHSLLDYEMVERAKQQLRSMIDTAKL